MVEVILIWNKCIIVQKIENSEDWFSFITCKTKTKEIETGFCYFYILLQYEINERNLLCYRSFIWSLLNCWRHKTIFPVLYVNRLLIHEITTTCKRKPKILSNNLNFHLQMQISIKAWGCKSILSVSLPKCVVKLSIQNLFNNPS